MTAGIKANVDGSAAIQVGGVDAITLTSAGAASFVTSPMTIQGGSAAAPSLTFSGDTNTGIFSPAADTIAFSEGGVESMRIDSAGNLLVGTTASPEKLTVAGGIASTATYSLPAGTSALTLGYDSGSNVANITSLTSGTAYRDLRILANNTLFLQGGTERMRIASNGNVSLGGLVQNPAQELVISKAGTVTIRLDNTVTNTWDIANDSNLIFTRGGTERARITSGGDFVVGDTSAGGRVGAVSSANSRVLYAFSTASSGFTDAVLVSEFRNYAPNNTTARLLYTGDNASERCSIRSNGGIANFTANNTPLSDKRLKRDITPAGSYLEKICAIPVVNYFYNDQTDDLVNLGVIAQDVLAAAPELCNEEGWGKKAEDGTNYLGIWETDIMYALMKSIQELKAELDATKAEVALLKGAA